MEGFFDGLDVMSEAMASATPTATQGVPAEAPIPSTELVPRDEGTHIERVSETASILAETLTPQDGAIPFATAQTEVASLTTPLVISTSDPFATLSQVVKYGSSLVVASSSIPSSTTRGLDADLSFEGSNKVLEDSDDEPNMKKRISDFNEKEGGDHEAEFMGMYLPYFVKFPLFLILYAYLYNLLM